MYSKKLQERLAEHMPPPVPITLDQVRAIHDPILRPIIPANRDYYIRYEAKVMNGLAVYSAVPSYKSALYFDISPFLALCKEIGIPYQFSIPMPDVVEMPVPEWEPDTLMLRDEAVEGLERFIAEAYETLQAC